MSEKREESEEQQSAQADDAVESSVPESLLAFAKDHRYVRQCQALLHEVLRPYNLFVSDSDTWTVAVLLYTTLVVARKGKTLGMEFCGLQHTQVSPRKKQLGMAVVVAGWALLIRKFWNKYNSNEERSREELRGSARRRLYEEQRRAMLQRASETPSGGSTPSSMSSAVRRSMSRSTRIFSHRIIKVACRLPLLILYAMEESPEGPHALSPTEAQVLSFGKWLLRLKLAHYCISGRYPTWMHHWLGAGTERNSPSRLSERPPSYRMIGRLILVQATAAAVKAVARLVARSTASMTHQEPPSPHPSFFSTQSEIPSRTGAGPLTRTATCGICHHPRSAVSAASSNCGHVMCWRCLLRWVSTVRPECPLCRVACRPQDVLALYHYEPSKRS